MKRITQCRACGSTSLSPAFSIENSASESGRGGLFRGGERDDIEYLICDQTSDANACGLLQRASAEDDRAKFERAPSGAHRSTRNYLRSAATEALELISGRDCAALDIGCSDGSLLSYYPRWVDRCGIDESDIVDQVGVWATTCKAAFPSRFAETAFKGKRFDIITAMSVLEDLAEPAPFLAAAKSLLTDDGVMVIETLYAPMMLTRTSVEAVFERRAAIYSLGVLERLLRDCGLKIFRGALTEKDGGSVRLFVTHEHVDEYDFDPWYERLARLWDEENALGLRLASPYQAFEQRVEDARAAFAIEMVNLRAKGEIAHIIGSGPSAEALYFWAGAGKSAVEAAVAHYNPSSDEKLFAGGPALVSAAEANALEPDCFIAPFASKRDVLEQWREPILRGANVLFPTPQPHMVHAGNFAAEFGKALAGGDGVGGPETLRTILGAAGGPRLVVENEIKAASSA